MTEHTNSTNCENQDIRMTRDQMQTEALVVETLLDAVMALNCSTDSSEAGELLQLAHDRARQLNFALDSVNELKAQP